LVESWFLTNRFDEYNWLKAGPEDEHNGGCTFSQSLINWRRALKWTLNSTNCILVGRKLQIKYSKYLSHRSKLNLNLWSIWFWIWTRKISHHKIFQKLELFANKNQLVFLCFCLCKLTTRDFDEEYISILQGQNLSYIYFMEILDDTGIFRISNLAERREIKLKSFYNIKYLLVCLWFYYWIESSSSSFNLRITRLISWGKISDKGLKILASQLLPKLEDVHHFGLGLGR